MLAGASQMPVLPPVHCASTGGGPELRGDYVQSRGLGPGLHLPGMARLFVSRLPQRRVSCAQKCQGLHLRAHCVSVGDRVHQASLPHLSVWLGAGPSLGGVRLQQHFLDQASSQSPLLYATTGDSLVLSPSATVSPKQKIGLGEAEHSPFFKITGAPACIEHLLHAHSRSALFK